MIPNAGTARYIPRFNAITDNPSPRTSDSEFAFSIRDSDEIIGVITIFFNYYIPKMIFSRKFKKLEQSHIIWN